MKNNSRQRTRIQPLLAIGLVVGLIALAACQPIQDTRLLEAGAAPTLADTPSPTIGPAMATISAQSLRVRSGPSERAVVIAGARQGETYPVLGISSDGAWLLIEIDRSPTGEGWVASSFVTLEGDITNIETIDVDTVEFEVEGATPTPTVAPTAEPTPEPTAEPTEEPTAEPTPEPTEEPTEEPTPEPTAEPTAEPEAEATPEPTEEPVAPAAEYVIIASGDLPLRVRSAPTTEVDNKIGNVFDGEVYRVLEVSADGLWVRIEVPGMGEDNSGWVFAEYVIFTPAP